MNSDPSQRCTYQRNEAGEPLSSSNLQADDIMTTLKNVSVFEVPQMDCPSEENLIRTASPTDFMAVSTFSGESASGWLQPILAAGLLIEVVRQTFMGAEPIPVLMMVIGCLALVVCVACRVLIFKVRNTGSHMKASMIFSANDVLANAGVIVAGGLVAVTGSQIPGLIIFLIITSLVLWGRQSVFYG